MPPLTDIVAVPFVPPLHETDVLDKLALMAFGCDMVADADPVHPFPSVMMHV